MTVPAASPVLAVGSTVIDLTATPAPDAQSVFFDLGEAGRAAVTRSPSIGKAVITTADMVSAPSGKLFELWLQWEDGVMLPAGLNARQGRPDDGARGRRRQCDRRGDHRRARRRV